MKAHDKIKDTGERMIPEYHQGNIIYGEHIVRYRATLPLVKGKMVLDVASGSGYGSHLMASEAKEVTGVDVDKPAIEYSKQNYKRRNLQFLVGDGQKIPVKDDSIDVVVSFETIEHIKNYKQFLTEIKRVLKADGTLVISTPNDKEFAEGNHFHYHEFQRPELEKLLKKYFSAIEWYYQSSWVYSALLSGQQLTKQSDITVDTSNNAPISEDQSLYFFVVCSNKPIQNHIPPTGAISQTWSARAIQDEVKKNALTDQHVRNLTETIRIQQSSIEALQNELRIIKNSRAWKVFKKAAKIKPKRKGAR